MRVSTVDEYVADKGNHCPVCGSDNIVLDTGDTEYGEGCIWTYPECETCGSTWEEGFNLAGLTIGYVEETDDDIETEISIPLD